MRILRCVLLLPLLAAGCPGTINAVTIRYQDPNYSSITYTPYSFSFSACPTSDPYLDNGNVVSADGCFGGVNQLKTTITSVTLTFENTDPIQNSGPNFASSDIFQNASFTAPSDPTDSNAFYTFTFSGGGLVQGETFVITEDGVTDPSQFPLVSVSFNGGSVTPEPSSLLLLATGMLCLGGLFFHRRPA